MVAAGRRNIKPGTEYDKFFGKPERKDPYWPKGSVYHTLDYMQKIVDATLSQTKAIAQHLKAATVEQTCRNVWSFLYNHVQYKEDLRNLEQLRSPWRLWADRKTGVDCDCFSITISSILTNLRIPHFLRITEYDNKGYFQHVYVVVPKDGKTISGRSSYFVIDPVVDQNDYEKPFSKKHDKAMIQHQYLNGIGAAEFGKEFDSLNGLGRVTRGDVDKAMRDHLVNTLSIVKKNPRAITPVVDPQVFRKQLEYLLKHWNNPAHRAAVLEELAEMEDRAENAPKGTMSGLGCACRAGVAPTMPKEVAIKKVELLAQRRDVNPNFVPATYKHGTIAADKKLHSLCQAYAGSPSMNGLNGKFFDKIKAAVSNTVDKAKTVVANTKEKVQNVVTKVQNVAEKVGDKVKTAAKNVVQQNPVTIAIRGGVLLAMKTNAFKLADRVKWGYMTEAEAIKRGFDLTEWRKVKAALDQAIQTFTKLGGKPENLKNAILTGKSGGLNGTGLGVVAAAGMMAAASAVIAKISGFVKNINNSKLLEKVKNGVAKAKELAAKIPTTEAEATQMINAGAGKEFTDEYTAQMQEIAAQEETVVNNRSVIQPGGEAPAAPKSITNDADGEKSWLEKNWPWLVLGLVVVGGTGYALTRPKALHGLIPDEELTKVKHASI